MWAFIPRAFKLSSAMEHFLLACGDDGTGFLIFPLHPIKTSSLTLHVLLDCRLLPMRRFVLISIGENVELSVRKAVAGSICCPVHSASDVRWRKSRFAKKPVYVRRLQSERFRQLNSSAPRRPGSLRCIHVANWGRGKGGTGSRDVEM